MRTPTIIPLPSGFGVDTRHQVRDRVQAALVAGERDFVFDASAVERFDSSGLGILLSLRGRIERSGGRDYLILAGAPAALCAALRDAGLSGYFALDPAPGPTGRRPASGRRGSAGTPAAAGVGTTRLAWNH